MEDLMEDMKKSEGRSSEVYKSQIVELTERSEELEKDLRAAEERLLTNQQNEKQATDLKEMIYHLEQDKEKLKEQNNNIKKQAEELVKKVRKDLKDTEYLIDKRIISDFLFKYFDKTKNEKIKTALLEYFSNLMGYDNDERKLIGLPPSNYPSHGHQSNPSSNTNDKLKDLSNDLYNFVMNG